MDSSNYSFLLTPSDFEKFGLNYPDSLDKLGLRDTPSSFSQQIKSLFK